MSIPVRIVERLEWDRAVLEEWVCGPTAPQRQVEQARIVLRSAEGKSGNELSGELGSPAPRSNGGYRYEADGLEGLGDRVRSVRPRTVTPEVEAEVVRRTLEEKPPERAILFSFDEKSQIQALDRTQPGLPLKRGRAGTMTHD